MLTIFAPQISTRLTYTLDFILEDRGIEYQLVEDLEVFENSNSPKFNYSESTDFQVSSLLFEEDIRSHQIEKVKWRNTEILGFDGKPDVLASIFYVLSLYDDYLQKDLDVHGRNVGKKSLLYCMNWIERLIVEEWIEEWILYVEEQNTTSLATQKIPFQIIPSFDIDHAYAYLYKPKWRNFLSQMKDVLKGDKQRIAERKAVFAGQKKDPFDTFEKIKSYAKDFKVLVFWLLGDYGKYDTNLPLETKEQQELIQKVEQVVRLGLHPSYGSNSSFAQLQKEKKGLEKMIDREVWISRQHFLKLRLPETYRQLQKADFTEDFSLSYADIAGFRAGTARPFLWFDLTKNEVSNLTLHSISYMDGTLHEYMNLSIEEAKEYVLRLRTEVQKYGGEFIPLWHNETIGDYGKWKDWRAVLETSLYENKG